MIDKILKLGSLIFFTIAIIILILTILKKRKVYDEYENAILKIDSLEDKYIGKYIIDQVCYYNSDSLKIYQFSSFYKHHRIFLYLPQNFCLPCIYKTMEFMKEFNPDYSNDSSLIFVSVEKRLHYESFRKDILILDNLGLGGELEKENYPFFFETDNNGMVRKIHIITNIDLNRTKKNIQRLYHK